MNGLAIGCNASGIGACAARASRPRRVMRPPASSWRRAPSSTYLHRMRRLAAPLLLGALLASGACSGASELPPPKDPEAPPPSSAPPAPAAAAAADAPGACTTAAACAATGKAAAAKGDHEAAARSFGMACDKGHAASCVDAAQALIDRPGGASGRDVIPFLEKGCAGGDAASCNGMGQLFHRGGDEKEAARAFGKGCEGGNGSSCHNLGVLLASGKIPRDDKLLAIARERACKAGEQEDCAPLASANGSSAGAPVSVPGANITVSGMEVDGVLIETLSCKVDGLGLLGAVVVGATLAQQRGALRACGLTAAVPVGWTIQRGAAIDATASSGDAKKDACIVRALKQIKSTDDGVCRAKVGLK